MVEKNSKAAGEIEKKEPKQSEAAVEGKSILASNYLHAAFMEADWIAAEYKELVKKYVKEPKIIRELYLCACDGVKINILQIAEKKKPIDESFRRCRKRHLEERFLAEYSRELENIKAISNSMASEVKSVSEKVNHIAEHIPSMEEMFPQTEPPKEKAEIVIEVQEDVEKSDVKAATLGQEKNAGKTSMKILERMGYIFHIRSNMPKYVESLINEGYSVEQIEFLLDCIEQGDTIKEVKRFASPKIDVELMRKLRKIQKRGGTQDGQRD